MRDPEGSLPDQEPENKESGNEGSHQSEPPEGWLATHCGQKGENNNQQEGKPQCVAMTQS